MRAILHDDTKRRPIGPPARPSDLEAPKTKTAPRAPSDSPWGTLLGFQTAPRQPKTALTQQQDAA
eukprot:1136559-Pyramimonas_sp.AAC.1